MWKNASASTCVYPDQSQRRQVELEDVRQQSADHHEHGMGAGMHPGTEFALSLMDVDEGIKMREECRDALQARLEKVNKRLRDLNTKTLKQHVGRLFSQLLH